MPTSQFCISLVSCIKKTIFIFIGITSLASSVQASSIAVSLDSITSSKSQSSPNATQGWTFQVTSPVTITRLGVFDENEDGLIESHQVAIWQFTNLFPILVSGTVASGTAAPLIDNFRYVDVSPTLLLPGNIYNIGAHYITGADAMITDAGSFSTNQNIVYNGGRVPGFSNSGFVFPGTPVVGISRFGPNFIFNSIVAVTIDVKPGSDHNCLNIDSHGVIPVAVLGSDTFDVTLVDQTTLSFDGLEVREHGAKKKLCNVEYFNDDAFLDLVCHFEGDSTNWSPGSFSNATVTGAMFDSTEFEGTDTICVVP